jgi:sterol desaturase/sphingolipid hydroxylase (fatty acid hydroxylase superfamily)
MVPDLVFGSAVSAALFVYLVDMNRADYDDIVAKSLRPIFPDQFVLLLLPLAVMRLVVDVCFYALHRTIHLRALYGPIHRRHHEHQSPHVWTNYHFTPADLFTEGFAPFGVGLAALEGLVALFGPVAAVWLRPSRLVLLLLLSHIMWYEICSHAGKPVPTASVYPPLSLAYNGAARLARWPRADGRSPDADNVWFHHCHHVYYNCNYGITPWIDALIGARRPARRPPHAVRRPAGVQRPAPSHRIVPQAPARCRPSPRRRRRTRENTSGCSAAVATRRPRGTGRARTIKNRLRSARRHVAGPDWAIALISSGTHQQWTWGDAQHACRPRAHRTHATVREHTPPTDEAR